MLQHYLYQIKFQQTGLIDMGKKKSKKLDGKQLWSSGFATLTADNNLDIILGSVKQLPLKHWRQNFFFSGAKDEDFIELTGGEFPKKLVPNHRHPVFSIKSLPGSSGFKVCPCSSKKPFKSRQYRYIRKECRLLHTHHAMDRYSYLVETASFNIPPTIAYTLWFKGEVPAECLRSVSLKLVTPESGDRTD